ncbi:MAG: hypothetical protein AB1631_19810 [Acidobacteriota bacterium]
MISPARASESPLAAFKVDPDERTASAVRAVATIEAARHALVVADALNHCVAAEGRANIGLILQRTHQ